MSFGARGLVCVVTLLSVAAIAACVLVSFATTLKFFGDQPSGRENAIAAQAGRTLSWALFSPIAAYLMLRGGRKAWIAGLASVSLLVLSTPWWYPGRPSDVFDADDPVWDTPARVVLWALLAVLLAAALFAAWRHGERAHRSVASAIVIGVAALCVASALVRGERRREVVSFMQLRRPVAGGAAELRALEAEPFWRAVPDVPVVYEHKLPASVDAFGDRNATTLTRVLAGKADRGLFRHVVSTADQTGWLLDRAFCYDDPGGSGWSWEATYGKALVDREITLTVQVASFGSGVEMTMHVRPRQTSRRPVACW